MNGIPVDAKKVLASGVVMTATLEGLEYNKTYSYVAFVTTETGETFYGEIQNFTDLDDGIDDVNATEEVIEVARYDIQGRKIAGLQKGVNIIRYADGTTRKVLVK